MPASQIEPRLLSSLRSASPEDLLKALKVKREGRILPPEMEEVIKAGEVVRQTPRKVTVFLKSCKIHGNQESHDWWWWKDAPAEVYVVALGMELSGQGQHLEKAGDLFQGVVQDKSKSLIVSISARFDNIWDGNSLGLLGNGLTLYGPQDPKGLLDLHVIIMDDDSGYRKLGQIIEDAAKKIDLPGLVDAAAGIFDLSSPAVIALKKGLEALVVLVTTALKNNKDDVIQAVHFSALAHQGYLAGEHMFAPRPIPREGGADVRLLIDVYPPA